MTIPAELSELETKFLIEYPTAPNILNIQPHEQVLTLIGEVLLTILASKLLSISNLREIVISSEDS